MVTRHWSNFGNQLLSVDGGATVGPRRRIHTYLNRLAGHVGEPPVDAKELIPHGTRLLQVFSGQHAASSARQPQEEGCSEASANAITSVIRRA